MEEPVCAQYAVQIAMKTLKDRCRILQQHVAALEEENLNLRLENNRDLEKSVSVSEVGQLREQITELTEQKQRLYNKFKMVTAENQDLWNKLTKLTQVNQNLGTQLSKINDSISQHTKTKEGHTPLIRSKTFTQDEPHTKVLQRNLEENGKISSELEEISLKIINSLAQSKTELDSLCSEITDSQVNDNILTNSFGFYYDEFDNNIIDEFSGVLDELKTTKETVAKQKELLKSVVQKLIKLQEVKNQICDSSTVKAVEMLDKTTSTLNPSKEEGPKVLERTENWSQSVSQDANEMICPMCSKMFRGTNNKFEEFRAHVESHFLLEDYQFL